MLSKLKTLLAIPLNDTSDDARLQLVISLTQSRLKVLLGGADPPEELEHIIIELSVIRFNRIGSEGLAAHSVEGESLNFYDSDFKPYMDEIKAYLQSQQVTETGRVRFL